MGRGNQAGSDNDATFAEAYKTNANALSAIFGMDFLQLDDKQVAKLREYEDLRQNLELMQKQYKPPARTTSTGPGGGGAAGIGAGPEA